jgi:hypothetical protein
MGDNNKMSLMYWSPVRLPCMAWLNPACSYERYTVRDSWLDVPWQRQASSFKSSNRLLPKRSRDFCSLARHDPGFESHRAYLEHVRPSYTDTGTSCAKHSSVGSSIASGMVSMFSNGCNPHVMGWRPQPCVSSLQLDVGCPVVIAAAIPDAMLLPTDKCFAQEVPEPVYDEGPPSLSNGLGVYLSWLQAGFSHHTRQP